ncbi:MAG: LssY C-terminal domain-containing protein [Candidatus Saccharibacteria bacterium]|nr:LssY C-terminal domain-containing protein [Candidatus Saccharibacteria bacterium]
MDYSDFTSDTRSIFKTFFRIIYLILLVIVCLAAYLYLFRKIVNSQNYILPVLGIWLLSAYVFLPRIHRWFSRVYLPKYYLGRGRTFDGFLGDPVNLAIIGTKKQLVDAMTLAGWKIADDLRR